MQDNYFKKTKKLKSMKLSTLIMVLMLQIGSIASAMAQCSFLQNAVSSSTSTSVQMNTNAFFIILPNNANQIYWRLTDLNDNLVAEDTSNATFPIFNFNTPLTDSMKICQTVTNTSTGNVCQVCDTLVYSGSIINWKLTSSTNVGIDITSTTTLSQDITVNIYPNPTTDRIFIDAVHIKDCHIEIYDAKGGRVTVRKHDNMIFDLQDLTEGLYLIKIIDINSGQSITKSIIKK